MEHFQPATDAPVARDVEDEMSTKKAYELHGVDLFKTQNNYQEHIPDDANILVFVQFPGYLNVESCQLTAFRTGKLRLSLSQLESTGSTYLTSLLANNKYQERAKKAAAPLPHGITYVLNLSPTFDEEEYTAALQKLSLTRGVKLWYRSIHFGTSPLATAGHDDECSCMMLGPEQDQNPHVHSTAFNNTVACIFDDQEWTVAEPYQVEHFSHVRWGANTLRLFRWIASPEGTGELLIDSAPRMWTLVGLFSKLQMTNYDILRDNITAWFIADKNYMFVEICPEETLYIGTTLKIPLIAEPAFCILVNERALEVAGGQPRSEPTTTIFGRPCANLPDGHEVEALARILEHAGTAMAERYKTAVDTLKSDELLDTLGDLFAWDKLCELDAIIPNTLPVRNCYDEIMANIKYAVHEEVAFLCIMASDAANTDWPTSELHFLGTAWRYLDTESLTRKRIDELRGYVVPKRLLEGPLAFDKIWASLNDYQRALTPVYWQVFRQINAERMIDTFFARTSSSLLNDFETQFQEALGQQQLLAPAASLPFDSESARQYVIDIFDSIRIQFRKHVTELVDRSHTASFQYMATPHLLTNCTEEEMRYLRQDGDETRFQPKVPDSDMGPSGPGPAFHTGRTAVPSSVVSESVVVDLENLALDGGPGSSTVCGESVAVQDGTASTVYDRRRVLGGSVVASEQFTDGESGIYAEAEFAVPAAHQAHGQALELLLEEDEEDESIEFGFDSDFDDDWVSGDDDNVDDEDTEMTNKK